MIQELKANQELITNNLKSEFNSNLMQTSRALNLINENQSNINYQIDEEEMSQNEDQNQMLMAMKGKRDPLVDLLLKQMTLMQNQLQGLSANKGSNSKVIKSDKINPKTGQPWKRYCWSCGCCPHWGKDCTSKKAGHKNEATFKNRMNGSDEKCL